MKMSLIIAMSAIGVGEMVGSEGLQSPRPETVTSSRVPSPRVGSFSPTPVEKYYGALGHFTATQTLKLHNACAAHFEDGLSPRTLDAYHACAFGSASESN